MKKLRLRLTISVLMLALMPAAVAYAVRPLRAESTHSFVGGPDAQGRFIFWAGAIFGDIEGDIVWFGDPGAIHPTGQASHYEMSWEIVDDQGNVLMAGDDHGTTTARHGKDSNWRTNGVVTAASGDYTEWLGRNVHMSGHFTWQVVTTPDGPVTVPESGTSLFRVN